MDGGTSVWKASKLGTGRLVGELRSLMREELIWSIECLRSFCLGRKVIVPGEENESPLYGCVCSSVIAHWFWSYSCKSALWYWFCSSTHTAYTSLGSRSKLDALIFLLVRPCGLLGENGTKWNHVTCMLSWKWNLLAYVQRFHFPSSLNCLIVR